MRIGIILSGGVGTRIGSDIPKQYIEVGGKPIISYCLGTLAGCVDRLQVVVAPEWKEFVAGECSTLMNREGNPCEVGFSEPGLTRQFSIYNALKDIEKYASAGDSIIIHDAARPMVTKNLCERCFIAIEEEKHDGAMPVIPVKDTIYFSMDGIGVTSLLDRTKLWAGQAPESFRFGRYLKANERLITRNWEAGGECIISPDSEIFKINGSTEPAKLAGMDIIMIEGEESNYKITTPKDLEKFREDIVKDVIKNTTVAKE